MRSLLVLLLLARGASARSHVNLDELDAPPQATAPPPPALAGVPPERVLAARDREPTWRAEGGFGVRFGSLLLAGRDVGTVVPLHLDAGLRGERWLFYGEYDLLAFSWPGPALALSSAAVNEGASTGLMQRLGGSARVVLGRAGETDLDSNVWAEAGAGLEHVAWDAGGVWTRADLTLGVGATMYGRSDDKHGGMSLGFRVTLAPRDNATGPPTCAGPCSAPTAPSGWDRSIVFDLTLLFGT